MRFYLRSRKNTVNAVAEYDEDTGTFTVLKGSKISATVSEFAGSRPIEKKRSKSVVDNKVVENVIFKSPSTAANFVTGRSTNGRLAWKNEKGETFKDVFLGKET